MISRLRYVILVVGLTIRVVAADVFQTLQSARALYDEGQFDEAERAFTVVLVRDAAAAEAHFWLGEIALQRNAPEQAIASLEKAVALAPTVSRYHHRLGDAFGRAAQQASIFTALGFARKCLAAFQRAVALDPANLDARYSLFLFYRGAPRIIGGGADKAAAEALAIKAVDPNRGRVAMAALLVSQKKFAAARAELGAIARGRLGTAPGPHAYLSDVAWTSAHVGWGEPAGNHLWFDEKNHAEMALLVHGRLYAKGLSAPAPSRYIFALAAQWKVFAATVGLQDGSDADAAAVFIVRGDGRELFRSKSLRVNASQQVKLDVAGLNDLELVTEPAGQAPRTNAVWADAIVRR